MSSSSPVAAAPALTPPPPESRAEQELAWVGDAVLALWARERVLREQGAIDTAAFLHLTANSSLQGIARPTRVEAEIGGVYRHAGLAAAFAHIETHLLPVFLKQAANRARQRRASR
jgi:dsRNA-specific ribonuclease